MFAHQGALRAAGRQPDGVPVPVPLFLAVEALSPWVAALAGIVGGSVLGWILHGILTSNTLRRARSDAEQLLRAANAEAEAARQRIELEAEKKARERRETMDREVAEAMAEIRQNQSRLSKREDSLDKKLENITEREARIDHRESEIKRNEDELQTAQQEASINYKACALQVVQPRFEFGKVVCLIDDPGTGVVQRIMVVSVPGPSINWYSQLQVVVNVP